MKKVLAVVLCLLMVISLAACGGPKGLEVAQGNTTHNANNAFGAAVTDGENIYFELYDGIFCLDKEGNIKTVLKENGYRTGFLLDGDTLYYEEDDAYYKIHVNGGVAEKVFAPEMKNKDDILATINLVDDKLYYEILGEKDSVPYVYDLKKNKVTELDHRLSLAVFTKEGIWSMSEDENGYYLWGDGAKAFPVENFFLKFVSGDYYYGFLMEDGEGYLSRVKKNSKDAEKLLKLDYAFDIDTNGTYIFYVEDDTLYRCDMDGKNLSKIYMGMTITKSFYTLNDRILVADIKDMDSVLLMDVNGQNQEELKAN